METSEAETPEIRLAWPMVSGLMAFSFILDSVDKVLILS
jgi:hypothetical protein